MAQRSQPSDDEAGRFGDDIDEVLSRANPNPERVGCPPRDTLIGLARRAQPLGDPAYEHLVKCSPCYREFRALQEERAPRQVASPVVGSYRGWMAVAAVAILAVGIAGVWFFVGGRPSVTEPASPSQPQIAALRTELDLRKYAVTRSDQASPEATPVSLPIGVVDLTLLLPVGSEPAPTTYRCWIRISSRGRQHAPLERSETSSRRFVRRSISATCRAAHTSSPFGGRGTTGRCSPHTSAN